MQSRIARANKKLFFRKRAGARLDSLKRAHTHARRCLRFQMPRRYCVSSVILTVPSSESSSYRAFPCCRHGFGETVVRREKGPLRQGLRSRRLRNRTRELVKRSPSLKPAKESAGRTSAMNEVQSILYLSRRSGQEVRLSSTSKLFEKKRSSSTALLISSTAADLTGDPTEEEYICYTVAAYNKRATGQVSFTISQETTLPTLEWNQRRCRRCVFSVSQFCGARHCLQWRQVRHTTDCGRHSHLRT